VDFTRAKIKDAVKALALLSRENDQNGSGVGFVIQPDVELSTKLITLKLDNVPVGEALRYMCDLGGVNFHVQNNLVSVGPLWGVGGCGMAYRSFHVDPSFVGLPRNAKTP
jgi:hypothetical protein